MSSIIPFKSFPLLLSSAVILLLSSCSCHPPLALAFTTSSSSSSEFSSFIITSPKTKHHHRHGLALPLISPKTKLPSSSNDDDVITETKINDDTTILTMTSSSSSSSSNDEIKEEPYYTTKTKTSPIINHELFQHDSASSTELVLSTADGDVSHDDVTLVHETDVIPLKPAMSFSKFLTMQGKRVVVTIRYSEGLKPFFLTTAKKIKEKHPHVVLEKRILPYVEDNKVIFEVLVDGKKCIGKRQMKKHNSGSGGSSTSTSAAAAAAADGGGGGEQQQTQQSSHHDMAGGRSVFISMDDLDIAIGKARKRRRPSTYYGRNKQLPNEKTSAAMRLEMLRKHKLEKGHSHEAWAD